MKLRHLLPVFCLQVFCLLSSAAEPLRVFIRSGPKSHGPGAHDHPSFLRDWVPLLNERGAKASGADHFPTAAELEQIDVLIIHTDGGGDFKPEEKPLVDAFTKRGGGIVVIHAGSVANTPEGTDYYKALTGGSWRKGETKWLEGPMNLYFTDRENLITKDCSNFEMEDEIYYDMDLSPDIHILAAAYTPKPSGARNEKAMKKAAELTGGGKTVSVYDIQPQVWTYSKENYRAFVSIPGHNYSNFNRPNFRALLLRGIAWAGKRANVDELCKPDELGDNLRYVEGGPTRPEKAAEKLEVHPDFNISLVGSEPLVNKVMNVDWDEKGRLWVVETPEYPNGRRLQNTNPWKDAGSLYPAPGTQDGNVQKDAHLEREPQDKISWLEDTNGDGVMDKKHVFADKLELCTSFCFCKSGVIACSAPDIWFLEDTTGKGVCDKRTKLYTGLGTGDTHAVINNLRWGLDGWVYATHGYSAGHVTSPDGSKDFGVDGSGVVRFKPDGSAFEMYSSRGGNTWGLDITWDGQVFWTQPTSGTVFFHTVLPEYVLAKGKIPGTTSWKGMIEHQKTYPLMTWKEQAYVQIDQVGQFTAAAGCAIYEGGAWPEKWNHSYFTTEPTLNIVHHEFVEKDGVSYKVHKEPGREETEFIRSKDLWFRPIENRVGPDGALYVVDFYNQAVIHNDTRGPLHGPANAAVRPDRDHYFSRIWKVQHKQAKKIEVPVLDKANANQLLQAISNPSAHVRMTASRLLIDLPNPLPPRDHIWLKGEQEEYAGIMEKNFGYKSLLNLALDSTKSVGSRAAALQVIGVQDSALMLGWTALLQDDNPVIRRLAALIAARFTYAQGDGVTLNFTTSDTNQSVYALLYDNDAQVRVAALRALASCNVPANTTHEMARRVSAYAANAIVKAWPKFSDDFEKSAATAALSSYAGDALPAILDSGDASLAQVASMLAQSLSEKNDSDAIAKLVCLLADKSTKADALKIVILQAIAQKSTEAPALAPLLTEALKKLLTQPALAAATLPLVSKWDKAGALADVVKSQIASLSVTLEDKAASEPARIDAARALIGTGNADARAKVAATLIEAGVPEALQREIITSLGDSGSVGELVTAMGQLKPNVQSLAFDAILKRPESSLALLDSIAAGKLDPKTLGPANLARLRTHPNKQVARKANELLKSANAEKNKLLATLIPEVEKPGDAAKGHMIFTAACSICHQIGTEGKLVGPPLTGMGAHGPGELIVSVIDPNREVDPSFWAWNVTKKNGEVMAGVIVSENAATLTLRNQTGDVEIKKDDIKTRENTRRSLMPEGFEALGAENLRNLLAFICGGADNRFRVLDLRSVYDAGSRSGIFAKEEAKDDTVTLHKFGNVTVEGVPFFIMDPEKSATGANLIALKGGHKGAFAESLPATVEIPISATAASLHFLGGVAGWGWPFGGDKAIGQPAMTVNVEYADGDKESIVLKNGEHFADYIGKAEVPLSDNAGDFTRRGQLRYFAINLKKKAQLKKLVLETSGSIVTPCTVAITAGAEPAKVPDTGERKANKPQAQTKTNATSATPKEGGKGDGPLMPAVPVQWEPNKLKVLIIGGGSSHNFAKFFGGTDGDTLKAAGFSVHYTEDRDQAAAELASADVAVISVNRQFFDTPAYRKALFDRVAAGKGVIMLHPGTWYGYGKWPELNAQIIGGGARGHDKLGPFSVHVLVKDHPVMKDVPPAFDVIDELYHVNGAEPLPEGTAPIEILAETTPSQKYGKPHPSIWITKNDKARIVGIALGHDEKVHDLPAFRSILTNAVKWVGGK